jgi:hypothetical protein
MENYENLKGLELIFLLLYFSNFILIVTKIHKKSPSLKLELFNFI